MRIITLNGGIDSSNNGQMSGTPIELPQIEVTTPISPGGAPSSADAMSQSMAIAQNQFPSDLPKYFTVIDIYKYNRSSLFDARQVNALNPINHIILPIPLNLSPQLTAGWREQALHAMGALGAELGVNLLRGQAGQREGIEAGALGGIVAAQAAAAGAKGLGAGGILPAAETMAGVAISNFVVVTYSGPQYRHLQFRWRLIPRTPQESENIRSIIKVLNNAMSPDLIAGGALFNFPKIIWMSFMPNSKYLYKFKPAVIQAVSANYAPGGQPSFLRKDDSLETNAPEGIDLVINTIELEYWINGDHNNTNEPKTVYTPTGSDNEVGQQIADNLKALGDKAGNIVNDLRNSLTPNNDANANNPNNPGGVP
jgi:hypothetical protein